MLVPDKHYFVVSGFEILTFLGPYKNIYILGVFTEAPCSKPLKRHAVSIRITTSGYATSMTSKESMTLFSEISRKTTCTVKILKFGTPQTIAIIVLKLVKFDVTLH